MDIKFVLYRLALKVCPIDVLIAETKVPKRRNADHQSDNGKACHGGVILYPSFHPVFIYLHTGKVESLGASSLLLCSSLCTKMWFNHVDRRGTSIYSIYNSTHARATLTSSSTAWLTKQAGTQYSSIPLTCASPLVEPICFRTIC